MKVLIIGGVAGGATAAARLRRLDETAEIVVLERSGYVSYANCGLPYYIGGVIEDREELTLQTPRSFHDRFRIDVRTHQEAVEIHRDKKTVTVRRLEDGSEYEESYDKLILSPGAKPIRPPVSGLDGKQIFTLRTVEDTFAIYDYIGAHRPSTAVVVGGGFIGLEMAENLAERGLSVTLLQRGSHVLPTFDDDMAAILHRHLRQNGVTLRLDTDVTGFVQEDDGTVTAVCADGDPTTADLVILAVGVAPESTLAKQAGLDLGIKDAIVVDEHMRTSDHDIYAVGDAVQIVHSVTGQKALISLAGPANKQGRIAADHICGLPSRFPGAQGSAVLKLFQMTAASTGLTMKQAQEQYDADYILTTSASHASYYPGAESMTVKVIFEKKSGRILGAQIAGFGGVDKRIDVLATAIYAGMTAFDLTRLDLAYAPPYSSAKDPVNMAGYVMENLLTGKVRQIHWEQEMEDESNRVLLDTRTQWEYDRGHVEGAVHIPLDELREHLDALPKDREIHVYCQSGLRSYIACRILQQNGFFCRNVSGGYGVYKILYEGGVLQKKGTGPCGLDITIAKREKTEQNI